MKLTDFEFRACQIILAAARAGADFEVMKRDMRQESIPERIWRPLYIELGLKILVNGEGENAEQYVYVPDNILPFALRTVTRCVWPEIRSGGSAA